MGFEVGHEGNGRTQAWTGPGMRSLSDLGKPFVCQARQLNWASESVPQRQSDSQLPSARGGHGLRTKYGFAFGSHAVGSLSSPACWALQHWTGSSTAGVSADSHCRLGVPDR